jgi:hypothetical protein
VIHAFRTETARAPLDALDFIAFCDRELSEICAVLASDAGDEGSPATIWKGWGHLLCLLDKRAKREKQRIGTNSTELAGYFNQFAAIGAEINGNTRRLLDSATEAVSLGCADLRSNHLANSFAAFA